MIEPERRRTPRIKKGFLIKYRCPAHGTPGWEMSPLTDFSPGGARFLIEEDFPVGAALELQMVLPMSESDVLLRGRLAWKRDRGRSTLREIGVEFTDVSPEVQQQLVHAASFFAKAQDA